MNIAWTCFKQSIQTGGGIQESVGPEHLQIPTTVLALATVTVMMWAYGFYNKGMHMKTTIEISDPLFKEAQRLAARQNTTFRSLVETGLREVLANQKTPVSFKLRKASFKGKGLQPDLRSASWNKIRELAYEN